GVVLERPQRRHQDPACLIRAADRLTIMQYFHAAQVGDHQHGSRPRKRLRGPRSPGGPEKSTLPGQNAQRALEGRIDLTAARAVSTACIDSQSVGIDVFAVGVRQAPPEPAASGRGLAHLYRELM